MKVEQVKFPLNGLGEILASLFNKELELGEKKFPHNLPRGQTIGIISDYGGQHKGSSFETYSFLVIDLDENRDWFEGQRHFRGHTLKQKRRMGYKNMNDALRRKSLVPFLDLADRQNGWLVSFCIRKNIENIFERPDPHFISATSLWKSGPTQKLNRVLHLSAFLIAGLSRSQQNVLWVCDEDDIAANADQLTQLTKLFVNVASNSLGHHLSHLRCGTTKSDDGTLALEDLASICDLSAGALADICSKMLDFELTPTQRVIAHNAGDMVGKTGVIHDWLARQETNLKKLVCVIDEDQSGRTRASILKLHSMRTG